MKETQIEVGLSLGSNLGDKVDHIRRALASLEEDGILTGLTVSSFYRTAPWGHVLDQDWFVNACAAGHTALSPADLLQRCKLIELQIGRTRTVRWGPRVIDIDLLYYGDLALDSPGLTIPHKEVFRRAFVLVPLAEIRPDRVISGVAVAGAARAMDASDVVRLDERR